jgi:hypothetical protein
MKSFSRSDRYVALALATEPPSSLGDRVPQGRSLDWLTHPRLIEPIGYVPPGEFEEEYYHKGAQRDDRVLEELSLH